MNRLDLDTLDFNVGFMRKISLEQIEGYVFNAYEGYWQESDAEFKKRILQTLKNKNEESK